MARPTRLLIVNPTAGGGTDPDQVAERVREQGPCTVRVTEGEGDARRFAREGMAEGVEMVVVAGGDGTIHDVVAGLVEEGQGKLPTLGLLPLGTGNDLVRSLGIPGEWSEAIRLLDGPGTTRELDLLRVELDGEESVAVNAVIVGHGGRVGDVLDSPEKARWGPLGYLRSALEVVFELEPVPVTLVLNGHEARGVEVLNIVVANGRYAGGGVPIAMGALPWDGTLEVVVVGDAVLREVLGMLPALLREEDPEHDAYHHAQATRVEVTAEGDAPLPVSVDGETGEARHVVVSLADRKISVLCGVG